jgi:YVTN family beta-propeller protein
LNIAISPSKKYAAITDNGNGRQGIELIDINAKKLLSLTKMNAAWVGLQFSNDNKYLYASAANQNMILCFKVNNDQLILKDSIATESHPNDMVFTRNGNFLFVANANSNSVSVIDAKKQKVIETLSASLFPNAPIGSTTNSVALSADDKTLYIANADNNCLAIFNVSKPGSSRSFGFIPTGWYPTCVRVVGNTLLVTNGK